MGNNEPLCSSRFMYCALAGIAVIAMVALITEFRRAPAASQPQGTVAEAMASISEQEAIPQPDIQHWSSSLGTKIYFVHTEQPEMLDIQLIFNSGSVREGDQHGLSMLTAQLIGSATKSRSQDEISHLFEQQGSQFYHHSGYEHITIGMRSLSQKEHLQPSIDLMTEVTAQPVFLAASLDRARNRILDAIQTTEKDPVALSLLKANALIYADTPYRYSSFGQKSSLLSITPEDITAFHQSYFSAKNLTIAMVGDISREQAEQISEQISLAFPAGTEAPPPRLPHTATKGTSEHIALDTSQSSILLATLGAPRNANDYAALCLASEILGGSFHSILTQEIRAKQGLAYDISSTLASRRYTGRFQIITQTRSDQMPHALKEIKRLLSDFIAHGPTEEQLDNARRVIMGSLPRQTANNEALLQLISDIGFNQLPMDEMQQFASTIRSLTREQVKTAFARMVNMETLTVVTAGKSSPSD